MIMCLSRFRSSILRSRLLGLPLLFSAFVSFWAGRVAIPAPVVALDAQPNLSPRAINLNHYSASPGDVISIAFTMINSGAGDCPASFTGVHIGSSPTDPPFRDSLSLSFSTPEIAANSSVRQTNTITIPFDTPVGAYYYIWVVADENGFIDQTTQADDAARSSALAVVDVPLQPNLVPQNVTLSATSARPGDQMAIAWTLANSGSVTCPSSLTGLHLGTSPTSAPSSDNLNLIFETPEIGPNSAMRFTNLVTIPLNTGFGTYYCWVVADDVANSIIDQSSREDDAAPSSALSVVSVITHPNLVPLSVTLSSSIVLPGNPVVVTWSVTNSGNANCPASITGFHLGTSPSIAPTTDFLNLKVATPAVNANSLVLQTNTVTIPASIAAGNYYLWVVVDDVTTSVLDQSSRADDALSSSLLSVVSVIKQPNLVATNVVLSSQLARPGDQITAIWTLTNSGNTNCPASQTGLRLGNSAVVQPTDNLFHVSIPTPEIAVNAFLRQTNVITLPANIPLGTNYLWVIADDTANSTLNQISKADDIAVSAPLFIVTAAVPQPNLVPLNIALSSYSARPGDPIAVTWTMTNSGNANCPASVTGLHLSPASSGGPTNDLLNLSLPTPVINANASLQQTDTLTIPASAKAGTYYVWVVADDVSNSVLDQSSRADDAARSVALAVAVVTLINPVASATVPAPPTFEWSAPQTPGGRIYLTATASPRFGTDKVVFFDNPAAANPFKPVAADWVLAVQTLGFAESYFWTLGSSEPAKPEVYADWRPFQTSPLPITETALFTSARQFQFQIAAPNQAQVIIQCSDTLTNTWVQTGVVTNVSGIVIYTAPAAGNRVSRFFRAVP